MTDDKFFRRMEQVIEAVEAPTCYPAGIKARRGRRKAVPIYEYKCDSCGERFEVFVSMGDTAKQSCPKCGHEKSTKLVSSGGFVLKGGGWYKDGYQKGGGEG